MDELIKKDLRYIWHPYTQMKECRSMPPVLIERAKGVKLYGRYGKFYYDTISSWWCNVHGHNHPAVKKAVRKQLGILEHVLFAGFTHRPAIELAERLIQIAPLPLAKVFFSDNGSTAVETALKMSYQYWHNTGRYHKKRFVSFTDAYHGDTVGCMSISGVDAFNKVFSPLFFKSYKVSSPCRTDELERLLKKKAEDICAVVVEPLLMAAGGMIMYPPECLTEVWRLAKKYKVHLILDEVATGFGRTGRMFACLYTDIMPDFMCLSKGITAGYLPLAATLTTDTIYNAFYDDYNRMKTFYHGHTYTANPLSCAAASASLRVFEEEDVLEHAGYISGILRRRIREFISVPGVKNARSLGMTAAVDIDTGKDIRKAGIEIYKRGLANNLILRPLGNVIYLFLPLCLKAAELNDIIDRLHTVLRAP